MLKIFLLFTAKSFLLFFSILLFGGLLHMFILEPSEVNGRSMENTFFDGDVILLYKLPFLLHTPKRGDLVSVFDEYDNLLLVKRIIGLPGEQVLLKNGKVVIITTEGETMTLSEPYIPNQDVTLSKLNTQNLAQSEISYGTIGPNEYFILGDNRQKSVDSRRFGTVHRSQIVGKVLKF